MGFVALHIPLPASRVATDYLALTNVHYENVVFYSLAGFCALGALWPCLFKRIEVTPAQLQVIKCFTLLELAAASFAVSLSNFSLAYLTTAFVLGPLALLAYLPASGRPLRRLAVSTAMVMGHPMVLAFVLSLADAYRLDGRDMSFGKVALKAVQNTKHALMYSVIDSYIYGSVSYALCCLTYLPVWTLLWTTVHSKKKAGDC